MAFPEVDSFFQEFSNFDLETTNTSLNLADPESYYALQKGITILQQKREKLQIERDNYLNQPEIARIHQYIQMHTRNKYTSLDGQIKNLKNAYLIATKQLAVKIQKDNPTISMYYNKLTSLRNELQTIKADIAYKSSLRGKQPNYNVEIVTDYEEHIVRLKSQIKKIKQSVQKDQILIDYPTMSVLQNELDNYSDKIANFNKIDGKYYKQLKELNIELTKEIWRSRYISYAETNSLNVDEENIFRVCNTYWIEQNMQSENIDCTFDCYCDYSDDDYDHVIEPGESRCTRGTKIIIEPNSDTIENNIGLINKQDFHHDYVTVVLY